MKISILIVLLVTGVCFAQFRDFPPMRPDPVPLFHVPRPGGGALDEGWQYMQTIADADTNHPELFNALPVEIAFTHDGRMFLATLHTVFNSADAGRTWRNLDRFPPPQPSSFDLLRSPAYISGLAARPVVRDSIRFDSLFISTFNVESNIGRVHLLYYALTSYFLQPDPYHFYYGQHWLTAVAIPDSNRAFAFAGMDRLLYVRDSLSFPSATHWDSTYVSTGDGWVSGPVATVHPLMMAVGSEHWISRDGGGTWSTSLAADAQGDIGVSFADTLHGLTGGGRVSPGSGWVHRTTDGGYSWSERVLETSYPIRCVEMVTAEIGFAAGGNYNVPEGGIWKTTDGGQTWNLDATMDAEITALKSERSSGAYVDVIAAGVFPDFRGGIWRNHLYLPEENAPALTIDPDTLDFGVVARGDTGFAATTVHNMGTAAATLSRVMNSDSAFAITDSIAGVTIDPGAELPLHVIFTPSESDTLRFAYSALLTLESVDGRTEITVGGSVPLAGEEPRAQVPETATLSIWPNPGNAVFQIRFELARASDATISIYDLSGRVVATLARGVQAAGEHAVTWNATDSASGIYFVRLVEPTSSLTQKLLLIK